MSTMDQEVVRGGMLAPATPEDDAGTHVSTLAGMRLPERRWYLGPLVAGLAGLAAGGIALFVNAASVAGVPIAVVSAVAALAATVDRRRRLGRLDRTGIVLIAAWAAIAVLLAVLPEYLYGWQVNGVIHKSAIAAPLLLGTAAMTVSWALRRLLGDTPTARDVGIYPLLLLPVVIVLVAYGLLLGRVFVQGIGGLTPDIVLTPWGQQQSGSDFVYQTGLRNHILGTLLLMVLTCALSILPGIGAAVYMTEYPGRLARLIGFSTRMLRAMSVFIIGVALAGFVGLAAAFPPESPISQALRGSFRLDGDGAAQAGSGSFLAASLFLSLLVIPIIAKFAEEGLRSVPREMREGSIAMGATLGYGLRRIILPWAAPNIVTGLLLGAAEAAGSLAIILFVAGNGEHGVGLTTPVTGLDYALFATRYGSAPFIQSMGYRAPIDYAYTSALLLLVITLGLTVVAMLLRRRFARRYRGSLTLG